MSSPVDSMIMELGPHPTVRDALRASTAFLERAGIDEPATDARRLIAHALQIDRTALLREPGARVDEASVARLVEHLHRRAAREPVSRIIGAREFYGLTLELNEATLDPRPDTETVVTVACHLAERLPRGDGSTLRILDLGTGTGAIALALLAALPDAEAVVTDISPSALEMAQRNAEHHGLSDRMRFVRSRWLDDVDGRFHLIVSNPPYIPTRDIAALTPEVATWDPRAALDGGDDGLDAYRAILATAESALVPGGWIVFEVGHDQSQQVLELAIERGFDTAPLDWPMLRDLGGNLRCVAAATPHCDNKKTLGIDDRSV